MAQSNKNPKNKQNKQPLAKKNILDKSAQKKKQNAEQKKKCSCCKWILGSFLLIGLIAGIIVYDTHANGKGIFEKSATGKILKDYGALPHVEYAWYTTMGSSARGYKWAQKNVPVYAGPVVSLSSDLFKLFRNVLYNACGTLRDYWNSTLPAVSQFLENYVPGFPKAVCSTATAIQNFVIDCHERIGVFVRTQILVGSLSPENIKKMLNDTSNLAQDYYKIFNRKVDAYAKLK